MRVLSPTLSDNTTIRSALAQAGARLASAADGDPRREAEILLAHVLGRPRAYLATYPEQNLPAAVARRFQELVAARSQGKPIAYLTGWREFWSRPFRVTPATLIPRPETERLVELALDRIPPEAALVLADLGTGSGVIALTLALERPGCRVLATDISASALAVARDNAARLKVNNIELRCGDWCHDLAGAAFDLIVANPPYVRPGDPHLEHGDLRFEPQQALVAGKDGLAAIEAITDQARTCLKPGGTLLLEHGFDQAGAVAGILAELGYSTIESFEDLSGQPRVTVGNWGETKS